MPNKISVITVVYNDVQHIRQTMESYFSQTWEEKEYIVIDGGSTDGTADIIREYANHLAYWCSEPDGGIYDAMNKGIAHATGDWIGFLNCGDEYCSADSLHQAMMQVDFNSSDVIYGNSIERDQYQYRDTIANADTNLLEIMPTFRHGSSLIRTAVQKDFLFDLGKSKKLGYSLDWEMLFRVYRSGHKFRKIDTFIETYDKEGTSNHPYRNLWYNYLITTQGKMSVKKIQFLIKCALRQFLKSSCLYAWGRALTLDYSVNCLLPLIPFWHIRKWYFKALGARIGHNTFIANKNCFINANLVTIGHDSHINRDCIIDGRGGIVIGNSVSVSHRVSIMTGSHDIDSPMFLGKFKGVTIDDYAWLGIGCTILQGVHIGRGAVVCAGAVVTKDVEAYSVVAGCPARKIRQRRKDLDYKCHGYSPLS